MHAASGPSGRSALRLRRLRVDAVRWLRSEVVDVVCVLAGDSAQPGIRATENCERSSNQLEEGLARWGRRFARQRLLVLAPRGLSLALGLSALIALALAVSGTKLRLGVAVCLAVPPLVALTAVLASAWRYPGQREVARVFDRDLALDESIGTALEISGAGHAVDGLAGLVLAQANSALTADNLSGVRPAHTSAKREWLASLAALVILSLLLVLIASRGEFLAPGPSPATSAGNLTAQRSVANAGVTNHDPRRTTAPTRNAGRRRTAARSPAPESTRRTSALSVVTQQHSARAGGRSSAGGGDRHNASRAGGRSGSQTAGRGDKAGTGRPGGGGGTRAGGGSRQPAGTHAPRSSQPGSVGATRRAGAGHPTKPQRVGTGSRSQRFVSKRAATSHGSTKAVGSGSSQAHGAGKTRSPSSHPAGHAPRSPGGQGHSAGNSAGAGSGGNPIGRHPTRALRSGSARLPIQAGYAPVHARSGQKSGGRARGSGGSGRARSATETDGGSAAPVTLPYIPPSADVGPVNGSLLRSYFSSGPTVSKRW